MSLLKGLVQIGIHRLLAARACKSPQRVQLIRALVGAGNGGPVDVGAEKRHVLAADHGVLHAARELIGDLPGGHDGLRGERAPGRLAPPR